MSDKPPVFFQRTTTIEVPDKTTLPKQEQPEENPVVRKIMVGGKEVWQFREKETDEWKTFVKENSTSVQPAVEDEIFGIPTKTLLIGAAIIGGLMVLNSNGSKK